MNLCERVEVHKQVGLIFLTATVNLLGSIYFGFGCVSLK